MSIAQELEGLSVSAQRRRLASMARSASGPVRRVYLSEIQALRQLRDRLRVRFCCEPRLELATDARCVPLPGVPCECIGCRPVKREWPKTYLMPVRDQHGRRFEASYECFLHSQSEFFLMALPSSSSIVRFG